MNLSNKEPLLKSLYEPYESFYDLGCLNHQERIVGGWRASIGDDLMALRIALKVRAQTLDPYVQLESFSTFSN